MVIYYAHNGVKTDQAHSSQKFQNLWKRLFWLCMQGGMYYCVTVLAKGWGCQLQSYSYPPPPPRRHNERRRHIGVPGITCPLVVAAKISSSRADLDTVATPFILACMSGFQEQNLFATPLSQCDCLQ